MTKSVAINPGQFVVSAVQCSGEVAMDQEQEQRLPAAAMVL